ncbi:aldehyde dehydrogenase family protein [Candidatus Mycobacterium methanotrophicum]|uniref:Putative succinate-semialdehyde dehydrogenase [NADP(+)] 2 n=1 Tax=Candidatus Mycobacterium methanotrophicum TaxID=2943498 RepID=A0ABY4QR41_9MYCO|nr:aldehyde dehydrogenase family protein [Candidatus Mycobacterium methanotrophicum]UQX12742.1 aldehyde dehydrogenase family protein [Candidatus Mycobacterium methanotrophicum]
MLAAKRRAWPCFYTGIWTRPAREADVDAGGYFVLPTVVTDLAPDSPLATEEQFGPVLPIFGYQGIDDAVAPANATDFGLTASIGTGDNALADRVAAQLVAGTVSVNCHGWPRRIRACRSEASANPASAANSVWTGSGRSPSRGHSCGIPPRSSRYTPV